MGIALVGFIFLAAALKGLGHLALDLIQRRMSRKQKTTATAALLIITVVLDVPGLVRFYGR
jgi:hypothetical protein